MGWSWGRSQATLVPSVELSVAGRSLEQGQRCPRCKAQAVVQRLTCLREQLGEGAASCAGPFPNHLEQMAFHHDDHCSPNYFIVYALVLSKKHSGDVTGLTGCWV